ncbi:MAG: sugar phosphate isomerase/epimerase [Chloroflexales bacterium]|nr:sugar phosphate isomerase/epimerase [Chloroflexales bacterium]
MQLSVISDCYDNKSVSGMLDACVVQQVDAVELGTGNFSSAPHCNLSELLNDAGSRRRWHAEFQSRGIRISALNCSGNLLDGDTQRRTIAQQVFTQTLQLAELLEIETVVTMSGCPGEPHNNGAFPNWVTCDWQPEFKTLLNQQWNQIVTPFWHEAASHIARHGVRVAIEMHPGQVVYNPHTFLQLHQISGDAVGVNLDPSHLFWQGIEPVRVVEALSRHIFHVHAKDCWINEDELRLNGGLDTRHGNDTPRAWGHCLWGEGHDEAYWASFVASLRRHKYTGMLSIEYAGAEETVDAGLTKTVALLKRITAL